MLEQTIPGIGRVTGAHPTMLRGFISNSNSGRTREDALLEDEEFGVIYHAARQATDQQASHRPHHGATRNEDSAFGMPATVYCGDMSPVWCPSSDSLSLHAAVHHASVEPEKTGPQQEERVSSRGEQRVVFTSRLASEAFADLAAGLLRSHIASSPATLGPVLFCSCDTTAERKIAGLGPLPSGNNSNKRRAETAPKVKNSVLTRGKNALEDDHAISHHEGTARKDANIIASKPTRNMPSSSLLLHRAAGVRGPLGGNRVQAITALLSQAVIDPTGRDSDGCTVLHHAATSNSTPVLACLLIRDKGCSVGDANIAEALTGIVNARDRWGWTALARASLLGHGETVSALLDAGADVGLSAMRDPCHSSPGGEVDDGGGEDDDISGHTALLAGCFSAYVTAQGCRSTNNNTNIAAGGAGAPGVSTVLDPEQNESSSVSLDNTDAPLNHEQSHIEGLEDDATGKDGNREKGAPGMEHEYRRWGGFLPIHLAASLGRKTVVEKLLDHLENSNDDGASSTYGNDANVGKATPNNSTGAPVSWPCTENGQTLLVLAGEGGHEEVVKLLLARGADPAEILHCGCSILHHAVRWQSPEVVKSLRDSGAQVDALDEDGATPLFVAAFHGFAESVDVLLGAGARVLDPPTTCLPEPEFFPRAYVARKNVYPQLVSPDQDYVEGCNTVGGTGDDDTALAVSSSVTTSYKPTELVHAEVDSGYAPKAVTDEQHGGQVTKEANIPCEEQQGIRSPTEGSSPSACAIVNILDPLMAATFHGHTRIVESLLNASASESRGPLEKDGVSPLHVAAQESRLDVMRLLLSRGASVHAKDFHGLTPLHTAARTDAVQCMYMLLNAGAKVNERDEEGKMPLHHAALAGKTTAIAFLLDRGADVSAADEHGATPLGCAANTDRPDAALLLLAHGADPTAPRSCGCPPMHDAAGAGSTSLLRYLRAAGAPVDVVDCVGCFPLHRAAGTNQAGAIATLVDDLGADVEARGVTGGITAAHVAAQEGSVEALEALLDRGALISAVDDDGLTPIHYACQCGNIEIVRTILKRGVFGEEGEEGMIDTPVVDAKSKSRGVTPLLMAANSGYTHLMELLNNGKRRRVALTAADASGSTALHLAASNGHSRAVELLLLWAKEMLEQETTLHATASSASSNDANVNINDDDDVNADTSSHFLPLPPSSIVSARTESQLTPLLLAASSGDRKTVSLLLDAGAEHTERCSRGGMPIHVAASVGHPHIVADLLGAGADPCAVTNWGETALHHAAACEEEGGGRVVRLLLRAGVPIQAVDKDGWSALHTAAACRGQVASLIAIIEAGSNPTLRDKNGWTPLHLAGEKGSVEAATALIAAGAPLDSASRIHSLTPLHQACTFGNVAVCQALLDAGASPESRDTRLRTPLHLAAANGHASIVDCLLSSRSVGGGDGGDGPRSLTLSKEHSGFTPLHLACEGGHEGATVALLAAGAPADVGCDAGYTPLHQAAATGAAGALRAVLAVSKASISARAQGGWTPVHLAAQNGHREALLQLALAFDNPKSTSDAMVAGTDCAVTPLHQAARNGHVAVTEILLNQFNVPPAPCDIDGETPLHTAAQRGFPCCIDALRRAGAPLEVHSVLFGAPTALHDACASLRPACVERLLWWGADFQALTVVGASPAQLAWFAVDDILGGDPDGVGLAGWGDVGAGGVGLDDDEEHAAEELFEYGTDGDGEEVGGEEESTVSEQFGESTGEGAHHHQGQQRETSPVEAGLQIDSVLRRAAYIRQRGKRDRTWYRRGWLAILRARVVRKERGGDASVGGLTTMTRERVPLTRGRVASGEGGGGGGGGGGQTSLTATALSGRVDKSTVTAVNRVIDMSEVGLFRHIISYI